MATLKRFKQDKNGRFLYRQDGSNRSVRFGAGMFTGEGPETIEIPGVEFAAPVAGAPRVKASDSPEVQAAKKILAEDRAKRKAAKDARKAAKAAGQAIPASGGTM